MYDERSRSADMMKGESGAGQQRIIRMLEEIRSEILWIRKKMQEAKDE